MPAAKTALLMSFPRVPVISISLGLSLAAGCAQVLGIEDADCDPSYSSDCVSDGAANANGGSGYFGQRQMVAALMGGSGGVASSMAAMGGSATAMAGSGGASGATAGAM